MPGVPAPRTLQRTKILKDNFTSPRHCFSFSDLTARISFPSWKVCPIRLWLGHAKCPSCADSTIRTWSGQRRDYYQWDQAQPGASANKAPFPSNSMLHFPAEQGISLTLCLDYKLAPVVESLARHCKSLLPHSATSRIPAVALRTLGNGMPSAFAKCVPM